MVVKVLMERSYQQPRRKKEATLPPARKISMDFYSIKSNQRIIGTLMSYSNNATTVGRGGT